MTLVLWDGGSDMAVSGLYVLPYVCLKIGMYLTYYDRSRIGAVGPMVDLEPYD
jgi:hypothetical protein